MSYNTQLKLNTFKNHSSPPLQHSSKLHSHQSSTKEHVSDTSQHSEEEDFMSDKFIQQPTQSTSTNHIKTYSENRKRKLLQVSSLQQKKSRAQREVDAREEGLSRNLMDPNHSSLPHPQNESHSKAVQMMLKMGFQPGTSLGPSHSSSKCSNNNPISIVPKSNRSGIGVPIKTKISTTPISHLLLGNKAQANLTEVESTQREAFLEISRTRFDSRKVQGILSKACRTCEELDRRSGLQSNLLWLRSHQEDTDHLSTNTKLDQLIHLEHHLDDDQNDEISSLKEEEERNWLALEPSTRLSYTLAYLRQEYFYCIWCGCQFESLQELDQECPGEEEDDH